MQPITVSVPSALEGFFTLFPFLATLCERGIISFAHFPNMSITYHEEMSWEEKTEEYVQPVSVYYYWHVHPQRRDKVHPTNLKRTIKSVDARYRMANCSVTGVHLVHITPGDAFVTIQSFPDIASIPEEEVISPMLKAFLILDDGQYAILAEIID